LEKISYIIWDWNGTLVNDGALFVEIMNILLASKKLPPITLDFYKKSFCFPLKNYYKAVGFDFKKHSYKKISKEFIALYNKKRHNARLYVGAKNILFKIKEANIKNILLSAQNKKTLVPSVSFYNLSSCFNRVLGLNNYNAIGKEAAAEQLVKKIPAKKHNILFVGDTVTDMKMGLDLGCHVAALACGHNSFERFESFKGLNCFKSFDDLCLYLNQELLGSP
tara:strand:+ start:27281 stop:27946 length:666 start_codon:yes stop_codon:yes gene_type:complete